MRSISPRIQAHLSPLYSRYLVAIEIGIGSLQEFCKCATGLGSYMLHLLFVLRFMYAICTGKTILFEQHV